MGRAGRTMRHAVRRHLDLVEDHLAAAVSDEAVEIRDDQRRLVPYDAAGDDVHIRDAIEVVSVGPLTAVVGIRDARAYYAVWIEFGRKNPNAKATPFVLPAYELARVRWPRRAAKALQEAVDAT